ncbi:hypothetical protein [Mesobacillus harenae]|uniref:hypothetical protein n=1 Tax=Mesobacillus harenae TaxID=2213203 RepID=UPI001581067D|nr:hypothetical protein [Mesobacillus harenae]
MMNTNQGMQQLNECRQIAQQLIQQTQQSNQQYRQMIQQEQQNVQMLQQMEHRERQAAQYLQQSLQYHESAIQKCQQMINAINQLEQGMGHQSGVSGMQSTLFHQSPSQIPGFQNQQGVQFRQ